MRYRIVVLASGSGTLTQAIIDAQKSGQLAIDIAAVISDKQSEVLTRAKRHGIVAIHLPLGDSRTQWDQELLTTVEQFNPNLVVSAGFMRILAPTFVSRFRCIYSHPSLLPNFPGAHAVRDALASGVEESGCTVHWIDEGIDTGSVIAQVRLPVQRGDSEASLHERIKIAERALIVETIATLVGEDQT